MADRIDGLRITSRQRSGVTLLESAGTLDSTTYLTMREAILEAALDEPPAVAVDIDALRVPAPSALAVFTSARWQMSEWPQTPMAVICASSDRREMLRCNGITRYVPAYATFDQMLSALSQRARLPNRKRVNGVLTHDNSSLWRARRLVESSLDAWALPEMVTTSKVVATVLVENALQHTESTPRLRLETDGETVTVAVGDDSRVLAERVEGSRDFHHPSGLSILASLSRSWGNACTGSGKTVWAVIGPENRL